MSAISPSDATVWTIPRLQALKGREKIPVLTAYDYATARLLDEAGIPVLLVGDSLAMTVLGYPDTLPVTLTEMLHHTRAVTRGTRRALVVGDMPFLSYQVSVEDAVDNAGRFLKEAEADAVKIEGGAIRVPAIRALTGNGIPVMGHLGLLPQSVKAMGGYKVQGREDASADALLEDACSLVEAGIFSLVLEGIPAELAGRITETVPVPTIGIGAGAQCDGQVLVVHDLLGLQNDFQPKFVKRYAELGTAIRQAAESYADDVRQGHFPGPEHEYH